jgi:hypothetical protein
VTERARREGSIVPGPGPMFRVAPRGRLIPDRQSGAIR